MGATFLPSVTEVSLFPSAITLLYQVILSTGTQSIIINRDTWRSNSLDKNKTVQ